MTAAALTGLIVAAGALPAQAQVPGCEKIKVLLDDRKSLVSAVHNLPKKEGKMNATAACGAFGKLTKNGDETIKWAEANRAWCQIPDQFIQGIKKDNERAGTIRGQACEVAAKQAAMEKKMREGAASAGPQGGGQFGGGGLTGEIRIPKGAL